MITFIRVNLANILIGGALLVVVVWISIGLLKKRRDGKSGCSVGCSGCPNASVCHKE